MALPHPPKDPGRLDADAAEFHAGVKRQGTPGATAFPVADMCAVAQLAVADILNTMDIKASREL